ncbi:unnamed protein product, partial [Dovyalis caffra]
GSRLDPVIDRTDPIKNFLLQFSSNDVKLTSFFEEASLRLARIDPNIENPITQSARDHRPT